MKDSLVGRFKRFFFLLLFLSCLLLETATFAQPLPEGQLTLITKLHLKKMKKNASGVVYVPSTNTFFVVRNNPEAIFEYSSTGNFRRKISLQGFDDTEGITLVKDSGNNKITLALVEEEKGRIILVTVTPQTTAISMDQSEEIIDLDLGNLGSNGLEGITYDPSEDVFFVVAEGKNGQNKFILKIHAATKRVTQPFDAVEKLSFLEDISGISYSPKDGHLFILSDQSKLIVKISTSGKVVTTFPLHVLKPEGIAILPNGNVLVVVGEPNQFFLYQMPIP